ncbi:MAG: hypothetical protein JSU63_18085 [Phycisphaerales bacterium]|nr:MAG: hypothetical protein JSU63_18085 [Phycisphaerales bacterium]
MKRFGVILIALALATSAGCGINVTTDYPDRLVLTDDAGQLVTLDDLIEIANDSYLDEDEKREAFRELGIEDEELIDALLDL